MSGKTCAAPIPADLSHFEKKTSRRAPSRQPSGDQNTQSKTAVDPFSFDEMATPDTENKQLKERLERFDVISVGKTADAGERVKYRIGSSRARSGTCRGGCYIRPRFVTLLFAIALVLPAYIAIDSGAGSSLGHRYLGLFLLIP